MGAFKLGGCYCLGLDLGLECPQRPMC
jgi:hypothetical protein